MKSLYLNSLALVAVFVLSSSAVTVKAGDLDGDGTIGLSDSIVALRVAAGDPSVSIANQDNHSLDADDGAPVDALYVDSEGKVGIGTTTPANELDVIGTIQATHVNATEGVWVTSPTSGIWFSSTGHHRINSESTETGLRYRHSSGHIFFTGQSVEMMRLTAAGSLGIGTPAPASKLDVNGAISVGGQTVIDDSGNWVGAEMQPTTSVSICNCDGPQVAQPSPCANNTIAHQSDRGSCRATSDTGECFCNTNIGLPSSHSEFGRYNSCSICSN